MALDQELPVLKYLPLDPNLLVLNEEDTAFLQLLTGIKGVAALKEHIFVMQAKAYKVFPFPCIRHFQFASTTISTFPAYQATLQLHKSRPGAILLDVGCGLGNDTRKVVHDGWPVEDVIASDLEPPFWDLGHEFFKSTTTSFPAAFVPGDVLDPHFIQPADPLYLNDGNVNLTPRPNNLRELKSLIPLRGNLSAIHISSLFHIFQKEGQEILARRLASLLSPEPGSVIFGSHAGLPVQGYLRVYGLRTFCHSPDSWSELWNGLVFKRGSVKVEIDLVRGYLRKDDEFDEEGASSMLMMVWSVTRL